MQIKAGGGDYATNPKFQQAVAESVAASGVTPDSPEYQQAYEAKMASMEEGIQYAAMAYKAGLANPETKGTEFMDNFSRQLMPAGAQPAKPQTGAP